MQARLNPRRRFILAHLEYAAGLSTLEMSHQRATNALARARIGVDRDCIVQHAANPRASLTTPRLHNSRRARPSCFFSSARSEAHTRIAPSALVFGCRANPNILAIKRPSTAERLAKREISGDQSSRRHAL
jgi:hypothetical protein